MTQRGVEAVLGRLAADGEVRRRFKAAPHAALMDLMAAGIELSAIEIAALEQLDMRDVDRFAQAVDPRLQKAELVARPRRPTDERGDQ